jgi:DTW domain-containing protein YfiP
MHRLENAKSTNTGRLATACLANSEIIVRGHDGRRAGSTPALLSVGRRAGSTPALLSVGKPSEALAWGEAVQPLLLFPFEDAKPIVDAVRILDGRPVVLVVPDGTWRQASKVRRRVPGLADVTCVSVSGEAKLPVRLRAEAHPHGLSTIEAIARAMGVLEGENVRRTLERVFRSMVERTLWTRGELATADVYGGIPEGALRHEIAQSR